MQKLQIVFHIYYVASPLWFCVFSQKSQNQALLFPILQRSKEAQRLHYLPRAFLKGSQPWDCFNPSLWAANTTVPPRLRETASPTFTIYRKFAFCCCDFVSYKYRHKTEGPNIAEQVWKPVALALCSCIQVCSGHAGRELSPHWAWVHSCSDSRLELLLLPSFFIAQTDTPIWQQPHCSRVLHYLWLCPTHDWMD